MILTVASGPVRVSVPEALDELPFPGLIAAYVYTRREQRRQQAEELERRALSVRLAAGGEEARHYARELEIAARMLRLPEVEPELPALPPEIDRILNPYAYLDASAEAADDITATADRPASHRGTAE